MFRCIGSGQWQLVSFSRQAAILDSAYVTKTGPNTITGTLTNTSNNYVGGTSAVVLACGSSGSVRLRPEGVASTVGELQINSGGMAWDGNSVYHAGNASTIPVSSAV